MNTVVSEGKEGFDYGQSEFSDAPVPSPQSTPAANEVIQWNASEFVDHQKTGSWFMLLALVAVVLGAAVYILSSGDILSTVVILVAALAFGAYARQKPRTLTYTLLPTTLKVSEKSYSYDDFKSFSVIQEGGLASIMLLPVKRFMPPLTIYFSPEDGERIFDALALHLPHEERKADPIDTLMRRIRF